MPTSNVCRAISIDLPPAEVRRICLDFARMPSWHPEFAHSIELQSHQHEKALGHGVEAQEGDLITFRAGTNNMSAIIIENSERCFSFQDHDIMTIFWEFIPLPPSDQTKVKPRTLFKYWEYQRTRRSQFWLRHGPLKMISNEELDGFNEALKKECER